MKNKTIFASAIAVAILATGTFAWQSFSQYATNEIIQNVDTPGARLHDYFNGSNKDVFVENYASGEDVPEVYARIRLSEYMEYGKDAGTDLAVTENLTILRGDIEVGDSVSGDPVIGEPDTWDIYDYAATVDGTSGDIREYRSLTLGGEGVYLPTFNQDNTSLDPDVKGTYRDGITGEVKDDPYDDYKSYDVGDEEDGYLVTPAGTADDETTHRAKATADATIMTMEEWMALDIKEKIGDYWVFDTTGWAYYAKPIPAESASGLLLDAIKIESNPQDEWYYAVDVLAQLCTFGDWGDEPSTEGGDDGTGMYGDMTDDSMTLLDIIANGPYVPTATKVSIVKADGTSLSAADKVLDIGVPLSLKANVTVANEDGTDEEKAVTWSVSEVGLTRTTSGLDNTALQATMDNGTFTPVLAMGGYTYTLTAASDFTAGVIGSVEVTVNEGRVIVTAAGDATTVDQGATLQFTASNTIFTNQAVDWSIDGTVVSQTTINGSGLLSVSLAEVSGRDITVVATSQEDNTLVGTYTVTVNQGSVSVTAAGNATTIVRGDTLQYSASIIGATNQGVDWEISGASNAGTEIDTDGLLTVAVGEPVGTVITVQATSQEDSDLIGSTTVTVSAGTITITAAGNATTVNKGATLAYSAAVTGVSSQDVEWTITSDGHATGTTMDETSGVLTVAGTETSGRVITIQAKSTEDDTILGTTTVTVNTPSLTLGGSATINKGASTTLTATANNLSASTVTWAITSTGHNAGTTINASSGALTVAAAETSGRVLTVTATSTVDTALSQTKTVTVNTPTVTVSSTAASMTLSSSAYTMQMSSSVTNHNSTAVTWSIAEQGTSTGASVSGVLSTSGLLTATDGMAGGTFRITATAADGTTTGYKDITIAAPSVTVSRTSTTVNKGSTVTFSSTVTGLRSSTVSYAITSTGHNASTTVNSSTGVLTIAGAEASAKVITVTATAKPSTTSYVTTANTKTGTNTVTVNTPTLTIGGGATTINKGASSAAFTASTTNLSASTVTWSISSTGHNAGTTINSSTGVLSVAGVETSARVITVKATSTVDTGLSQTKTITVNTPTLTVSAAGSATTVDQGATLQFSAATTNLSSSGVTWSITSTGHNSGTTISTGGLLTIAAAETENRSITVQAKSSVDTNLTGTKSVVVTAPYPSLPGIGSVTAGTTSTVTVDGVEFYVLAKTTVEEYNSSGVSQGTRNAALIWAKDNVTLPSSVYYSSSYPTSAKFHTSNVSTWTASYMRASVLPAWMATMPTLSESTIMVKNTTSGYYTDSTSTPTTTTTAETTYDSAFLLSQPEFLSYVGLDDTRASASYHYWLRSAYAVTGVRGVYNTGPSFGNHNASYYRGVRPALWVYL